MALLTLTYLQAELYTFNQNAKIHQSRKCANHTFGIAMSTYHLSSTITQCIPKL